MYTVESYHEVYGEIRRIELQAKQPGEAQDLAQAQLLGGAIVAKVRDPRGTSRQIQREGPQDA